MSSDISVLNEVNLKIDVSPEILELKGLNKTKKRIPAILDFDKGRKSIGWHFKFTKAFEAALGIMKNKEGERRQNDAISLQEGDSFYNSDTWSSEWFKFTADQKSRIIQIHFAGGDVVRFFLYKPTKKGDAIEKTGRYMCSNLEFLHILKYGIDQYIQG